MKAKKFICFILGTGASTIVAILSSEFGVSRFVSFIIGMIIFIGCFAYIWIHQDK